MDVAPSGPVPGDIPSGATMQPRYMQRIMNTYPVSEPEMDLISYLNTQATVLYSVATFLFGLASSIWINATFYNDLTAQAVFATRYAAPFFLLCAVGCAIAGSIARYQRGNIWDRIKLESNPVQTVMAAPVVATTA
jgi:hypothetical protein